MSGSERGYVEILVHTSAPSRGQDDTRYRALAQAYLDFEPANRRTVLDGERRTQDEDEFTDVVEPDSQASYRPDDELEVVPSSFASLQNAQTDQLSQSQAIDSFDLSFNSVLDNANSPVFRERLAASSHFIRGTQTEIEIDDSPDSWQPPPSTIPDSQPENNPTTAAYSSPTRVLEFYLRQMESSKLPTSGAPPENQDEDSTELPDANMQVGSSIDLDATEKSILSSGPPSPIPHGPTDSQSRVLGSHRAAISNSQDPGDTLKEKHYEPSSDSIQPSSPAPENRIPKPHTEISSQSHVLQNRRESISNSQDPVDTLKRKHYALSSDSHHPSSPAPEKRISKPPSGDDVSSNPNPSTSKKKNKITSPIQKTPSPQATTTSTPSRSEKEKANEKDKLPSPPLPTQHSNPGSFRASYLTIHEVRPPPPEPSLSSPPTASTLRTPSLEQLALKMPLSILYRPALQARELRDMERGFWLIACGSWRQDVRERCWDFLGNFVAKGQAGWGVWCVREEEGGWEGFKVYCWGALAGHVYLLVYMASEGKVRGTGARWMGGDGRAVVTMPG